jgi:two-component system chemotaxis response regulator CheB
VLLVDDSAVVRGLASRWLSTEAGIELVAMGLNGRDAVRLAGELSPDVVVLDIEMPELDGLSALPLILAASPGVRILMASTLTHRNAEITLKALSLGATDYLPKPETGKLAAAADFRRDLIARIRGLGRRRVPIGGGTAIPGLRPVVTAAAPAPIARVAPPTRPINKTVPELVLIGSSTGGPQALQTVVKGLAGRLRQPLLIVQHMPPMFTTVMADQLAKLSSSPAVEAKDGMPIRPGHIYIAPGDYHMTVVRRLGSSVIALDRTAPVNFCRPAVDPLFNSAVGAYGGNLLAAILTGMGSDGRRGCETLVDKGGNVIAQDEATSVVWGMPGAVATAGLACAIRPLDDIAQTLLNFAGGKA